MKKIGFISLGCPKNLVDTEIMITILNNKGYSITNDSNEADIIVINTCGFIESAKQESIDTIIEMGNLNKNKKIIVAGCLAQRYGEEIIKEMPEVSAVVGTGCFERIIEAIEDNPDKIYVDKPYNLDFLKNKRNILTNNSFAYLKIAEGCDNCCSYCVIPSIRGGYKSRNLKDVVQEAEFLAKKGIKEIILIAQDTTRYGMDIYGKRKISELIREIGKIREIEWIRLLYCYPDEIDDELINEISQNEKVCNYIDIPIQHASNKILKAMKRRGNSDEIQNLIDRLRSSIKGVKIRSSLIVGFPGETKEDFKNLCDFVQTNKFDRLGVFIYSKEEGTIAYNLKGHVPATVKERRYKTIMEMQKDIIEKKNRNEYGRVYKTIVEGVSDDGIFYYGRTYGEAPDIDNQVYFTSMNPLKTGQFVNIRILNVLEYDLIGEVVHEFAK